ncbi:hypothetical protein SDC9_159191 [bioreactor metagenome]|uniref:Uncharacterized protein n=1 Tax=bioreactor metagenome TaxID=1076179 RepID=A0A645FEH8_9ZZZZ
MNDVMNGIGFADLFIISRLKPYFLVADIRVEIDDIVGAEFYPAGVIVFIIIFQVLLDILVGKVERDRGAKRQVMPVCRQIGRSPVKRNYPLQLFQYNGSHFIHAAYAVDFINNIGDCHPNIIAKRVQNVHRHIC